MKKLHKIGTSILAVLAPAAALGIVAGAITIAIKNKQPEPGPGPVDPEIPVTGLEMPETTYLVADDTDVTLDAVISPSNASIQTMTWESDTPSVISVDKNTGKLTPDPTKAGQSAKITCTTVDGGFTKTCTVTLKAPTPVSYFTGYVTEDYSTGKKVYRIDGYADGANIPEDLVLPSTYTDPSNGETYPITEFYTPEQTPTINPTIKSAIIPSSYGAVYFQYGFTGLKSVSFSDAKESNYASLSNFEGCTALETIRLSHSIKSIGSVSDFYTFENCANLTTVDLTYATNLETIGQYAFKGCNKLQPLEFPDSFKEIFTNALPYSTTAAYSSMFKLEQIVDGVTAVYLKKDTKGTNDHFICYGLLKPTTATTYNVELQLHEDTKIVAGYWMDEFLCETTTTSKPKVNIKKITFNEGLKYVGYDSFTRQNENYMPMSLKVEELKFPSSLIKIDDGAFCLPSGDQFIPTASLKSVTFNEGLKYIGDNAFGNQYLLEKIQIPSTVESIGNVVKYDNGSSFMTNSPQGTFDGCSGVTEITFADNSCLKSIGNYAFANMVTSGYQVIQELDVVLPETVEEIGVKAFYQSFIPKSGFKVPSSCKYLGQQSLAFFNQDINLNEAELPAINIEIPSSVSEMCCPFGYSYTGQSTKTSPVVTVDTLTFEDKTSQWDVYDTATWPETFAKTVGIESTSKLSSSDFTTYMIGYTISSWEDNCYYNWYKK